MEKLGNALREIRLRHDCALEEISRRTRISLRILREMESGDFHSIRGRFYTHQFIREYLKALGEDPVAFLEQHDGVSPDAVSEESRSTQAVEKLQVYRFRRRRGLGLLLALMLLAAAAFFLFAPNIDGITNWFVSTPRMSLTGAAFEPGWMQPGRSMPGIPGRRDGLCPWLDRETRIWGVTRPPATVHARFSARCWAQVRRGGRVEASRIFLPGEELLADGYDLQVSLGNPSVVSLTVNGSPESRFRSQNRPVTFQVEPEPPFRQKSQ